MEEQEKQELESNEKTLKNVIDNMRISNYVTGQRWITLKGDFTSSELISIAEQIEKAYNKAFKNNTICSEVTLS